MGSAEFLKPDPFTGLRKISITVPSLVTKDTASLSLASTQKLPATSSAAANGSGGGSVELRAESESACTDAQWGSDFQTETVGNALEAECYSKASSAAFIFLFP